MSRVSVAPEERWVVVGDMQVPFHDPAVVELATQLIENFKPHHLVYNGDGIDFSSISSHQSKRHELRASISMQEEVDYTIAVQDQLARGLHRLGKRYQIDGNHEVRLERFLGTGPSSQLGSLKGLQMDELFQYRKRGFSEYYPFGEGKFIAEDLYVFHGSLLGQQPGYSVTKEVMARGCSVIIGHAHRSAHLHIKQGDKMFEGIETGCLCQLSAAYRPMTNWSWSIVLIEKYKEQWNVELVRFYEGKGVVYAYYRGGYYEVPCDLKDGMSVPWRPDQVRIY